MKASLMTWLVWMSPFLYDMTTQHEDTITNLFFTRSLTG